MVRHPFRLVALLPPRNVEAQLWQPRRDLVVHYGMAGARSLPPHIPLRWVGVDPAEASHLLSAARSRVPPLSLGGFRTHLNAVEVEVDPVSAVDELRAHVIATMPQGSGLYPVRDGIVIAFCEHDPPERDVTPLRPIATRLLRRPVLSIIEVTVAKTDGWWHDLSWRQVYEYPVHRRPS